MIHHQKTRVVLANGGHAKWLERDDHHFVMIAELEAEKPAPGHHTGTVQQSSGSIRHVAGVSDLAAKGREQFGGEIAERLNRQAARGEFFRLAIVAPPEMIRAIRDRLLPGVRDRVVYEIPKDLTKTPVNELGAWLDTPLLG
jgi:protein required for attachment to host cells